MIFVDYINELIQNLSRRFGYAYAGDFDDSGMKILTKESSDSKKSGGKKADSKKLDKSENEVSEISKSKKDTKDETQSKKVEVETKDSAKSKEVTVENKAEPTLPDIQAVKKNNQKNVDKFFAPVKLFKRVEKEYLHNTFGRVVTAKTSFYGKPFKVHILAKDIVRYNAKLMSEKLRIANTKYCLQVKKLIDSCMANARYFGIDESKLCIKSLHVGRGKYLKRREFKGRGRTGVIWRPFSNVEIKLQEVNFG